MLATFTDVCVFVSIAKLNSFMDTSGSTRGNSSTEASCKNVSLIRVFFAKKKSTLSCVEINLDSGVTARVEDLGDNTVKKLEENIRKVRKSTWRAWILVMDMVEEL